MLKGRVRPRRWSEDVIGRLLAARCVRLKAEVALHGDLGVDTTALLLETIHMNRYMPAVLLIESIMQ